MLVKDRSKTDKLKPKMVEVTILKRIGTVGFEIIDPETNRTRRVHRNQIKVIDHIDNRSKEGGVDAVRCYG